LGLIMGRWVNFLKLSNFTQVFFYFTQVFFLIHLKSQKKLINIQKFSLHSFIACWLPFFFLYILTPACKTCVVPDWAFAVAFWLGYMNSALNPAIYTIFNKDFRRAFRRILFKWCLSYICCYRCVSRSIEKATEKAMMGTRTPLYGGYLRSNF
jgi:hypothetical protein